MLQAMIVRPRMKINKIKSHQHSLSVIWCKRAVDVNVAIKEDGGGVQKCLIDEEKNY